MSDRHPATRAFEALASSSRRQLLFELWDGGAQSDDCVDPVALLADGGTTDVAVDERIELTHHHLPKLDAFGYLDWDAEAGTVRRGPDWGEIAPLLRVLTAHREELPEGWL